MLNGNAADQKDFGRGADNPAGGGLGPRCAGLETAPQSAVRLASALQAKAGSPWPVSGGHRLSASWLCEKSLQLLASWGFCTIPVLLELIGSCLQLRQTGA